MQTLMTGNIKKESTNTVKAFAQGPSETMSKGKYRDWQEKTSYLTVDSKLHWWPLIAPFDIVAYAYWDIGGF